MKKKYSDPLMFASGILLTIPQTPSQTGHISPDDDLDTPAGRSIFSVNSITGAPAAEDTVTIVNTVEEASTSATTGVTTENPVEEVTTTPLEEVPSVIDEMAPAETEEAATAASTVQ